VAEQRLQALKTERQELEDDKEEAMKALAALEMVVKDLEEQRNQSSEAKVCTQKRQSRSVMVEGFFDLMICFFFLHLHNT
jgi:flagellar motility protein MotE (MotC chaperone)